MNVSTNISALNAIRSGNMVRESLADSVAKLSSGKKINSAADDASGLAISEKLRAQIRGLERAGRNVDDAMNYFSIANSALQEIDNILLNAKELSTQASNDTYSFQERKYMDNELQRYFSEVREIMETTKFNNLNILKGTSIRNVDYRIQAVNIPVINARLSNYTMDSSTVSSVLKNAQKTATTTYFRITDPDTNKEVAYLPVVLDNYFNSSFYNFLHNDLYDSNGTISDQNMQRFISTLSDAMTSAFHALGQNVTVVFDYIDDGGSNDGRLVYGITGGNYISYSTCSGATTGSIGHYFLHTMFTSSSVQLDFDITSTTKTEHDTWTHIGRSLWVQAGANEGDAVLLEWNSLTMEQLGITNSNLLSHDEASKALFDIETAIRHVLSIRTQIAAIYSRLERKYSNINNAVENLTDSESRILNTDMAKEMTNFVKRSIISDTSNAILAQANQLPQHVLQLLA